MASAMRDGLYPEDCDSTGVECVGCVTRTAESMRALTVNPTAEWASGVFQQMYKHAACRQMEHSFVWACGAVAGELVQIGAVAA